MIPDLSVTGVIGVMGVIGVIGQKGELCAPPPDRKGVCWSNTAAAVELWEL